MATDVLRRYAFPRIRRVRLHSFSLYSERPDVTVEVDGGVLCLAGANGVGKSTFLATVNYGLTGAVPHPRRRLLSNQAYFKEATDYAASFFTGRIAEKDRDDAAVTLEFEIGGSRISLTRGLLDPNDVRSLSVDAEEIGAGTVLTPLQRADRYRELITQKIGLTSFEQFVFLQHFVFTFDEARHLLFWDQAATAQSLFLCFGVDPHVAVQADSLHREAEKAGSRGRNAQFQVNNTRKRIEIIQQSAASSEPRPADIDDLDVQYRELEEGARLTLERSEQTESRLSEAEVKVAQHSAAAAGLRAAYEDTFNRFLHGTSRTRNHALVLHALRRHECGVCETRGPHVAEVVQARLDERACPFCGSPIEEADGQDAALKEDLQRIDKELTSVRGLLEGSTSQQQRLRSELTQQKADAAAAREALMAFENAHHQAIEFLKGEQAIKDGPIAQTLQSLRQAMEEFLADRAAAYAERDRLLSDLKELQRELELRYARAEESFLPRFRKLAELFLGIYLDVSLQLTAPVGMKLLVEMRGNTRHDENQMSESQRFFVDIALRMALAQQMSVEGSPATLVVDTPEGSLDIAYEDRAGEMFAQFVESGHDMLMTANINSSKLLITLARRCGSAHMSLNPITGWSELSDVQQNATTLFEEAYGEITEALRQGPAA